MKGFEARDELQRVLDKAVRLGASYADARYQRADYEVITVENKALKSYSSRSLCGFGVRVAVKGAVGYASTSELDGKSLEKTLRSAVKAAKSLRTARSGLAKTKANKAEVKLHIKKDPANVSPEEKVSVVMDANRAAWVNNKIKSAMTSLGTVKDSRVFTSSEGSSVNVDTTLVGIIHESVAKVKGVMERVPYHQSLCAGFEFIESQDWNSFTANISELATEAASAKSPPPGTYPVVVDPEVVGVLLHEAFGHASEGDLVSTGESVLGRRRGLRLATESVTIADKGVIDGGYFYPFDDEGTKKEETVIVKDGVLKSYIHDRQSAVQLSAEPTGNGRAQNFESMPIVRQTNYYVKPRDCKFEELVEDIDSGVYVEGKGMTGGEVEVGMGTFTFNVGPSKMITKGELGETVKGVVISGLILETLKTMDAVGNDLKIKTSVFGGCGKKGQAVPVGFGGPHVRIRKMTIGGR